MASVHSVSDNKPAPATAEDAPGSTASSQDPTPWERKWMAAPMSPTDHVRQNTIRRIDPFGHSSLSIQNAASSQSSDDVHPTIHVTPEEQAQTLSEDDLIPSPPNGMAIDTLEGHEQFKRLVRYARHSFGIPLAMLSVVDGNRILYLAESGLGLSETPRDIQSVDLKHLVSY